jgi:hypothetical protein
LAVARGRNPRQFQNGTTVPTIASLPATPTSSFEETKKIHVQKALLASPAVELKLPLISPMPSLRALDV